METRIIYVSMDQDSIIKFWNSRPYYNEDEDEFHGKIAKLSLSTLDKVQIFAENNLEMGCCVPVIIAKSGFHGPSYSQKIKNLSRIDDNEVVHLLELGFRQIAISLGKEDEERYEGYSGLDITPFKSRIIRFLDKQAIANEMITDIFACEESQEGDEDYLYFMVKTENMYGVSEEYMDIHEIIRNNPNHYFDLLTLLEILETHVIFENEIEPSDIEMKRQILAGKIFSCSLCFGSDTDSNELHELCSMISKQFDIKINANHPGIIESYMPRASHSVGTINGISTNEPKYAQYTVIGKLDEKDNPQWWIAVNPETLQPLTVPFSIYEATGNYYARVTGQKNDKPELYSGYDFYSEIVSETEAYDKEQYGKKFLK